MKPIMILGVVLIVLGIGGLAFRSFHWTETKEHVANIGPLHINSEEDHSVWIPTAAGVACCPCRAGPGHGRAPLSLIAHVFRIRRHPGKQALLSP